MNQLIHLGGPPTVALVTSLGAGAGATGCDCTIFDAANSAAEDDAAGDVTTALVVLAGQWFARPQPAVKVSGCWLMLVKEVA